VSDETPEERAERAARMASKGRLCYPADVAALAAELDRLRHGEKVRDGMLRRFKDNWWLGQDGYWKCIEDYGGEMATENLTPDEVAVLAALDTEEPNYQGTGGEQ
jgi:hypothetical protein